MPQSQTANIAVFDFGAGKGPAKGTAATLGITLSTVVDTNTVTLSDGILTKTFEFESTGGVTSPNISVTIGASDTTAAAALAVAINASGLRMSAISALGVATVTAVTVEGSETAGNAYTATKVGSPITLTGAVFAGGVNADLACKILEMRAKRNVGGKLTLKFENPNGDADIVVTVQVATTRTGMFPVVAGTGGYADTSAAANLTAVAALTVPRRSSKEAVILIRRDVDAYLRVLATGSARGQLQVRGDTILEPMRI